MSSNFVFSFGLYNFNSNCIGRLLSLGTYSGVPTGGGWGVQPPSPKFRRSSKIVPTSIRLWKLLKIAEFRMPTPQDVRKKGSKILKLPPVRNCFTLVMKYKLVVIINSLKLPKIKKISLYKMKFLVPNYSCLQNPWLGGYRSQIPVLSVLCPELNLLNPPPPNKIPGYATGHMRVHIHIRRMRSFYASDPFVSLFWESAACHAWDPNTH